MLTLTIIGHESRETALKWCRLSFAVDNSPRTVYFDLEVDGLIMQDNWDPRLPIISDCQHFLEKQDRQAITRLLYISPLIWRPFARLHSPHYHFSGMMELYLLHDLTRHNLDNFIGSIEESCLQKGKTSLTWQELDTSVAAVASASSAAALGVRHPLVTVLVTDLMQNYKEWLKLCISSGDPPLERPIRKIELVKVDQWSEVPETSNF